MEDYATTSQVDAVNRRVDKVEEEIEEIKRRLGIKVINHKFKKTDVHIDFSGNNKISTGVQGCADYTPVFAIPHDSGIEGVDIEACYLSGGQVHMRLYTDEYNRIGTPSADVVYFKTKFVNS